MDEINIFGARASVYINYGGDLSGLSRILSNGLKTPAFTIENKDDYPYELYATCEALGFELWLEILKDVDGFNFLIKIETELSHKESFNNHMHDLSHWLARYIKSICKLKVFPAEQN